MLYIGIDFKEYLFLFNKFVFWYCIVCYFLNYLIILFDLIDFVESNIFLVLLLMVLSDVSNSSFLDISIEEFIVLLFFCLLIKYFKY